MAPPPPVWGPLLQPVAFGLVGVAAVGAALGLALLIARVARLQGVATRAVPASLDLERFVGARSEALGVAPPEVWVSAEISTAVLTGVRWPKILLPLGLVETMTAEALHLICAHELAHLRRRDHLRAPIERAVAALLWFNPFILDALARTSSAREALCDAVALEGAAPVERHLYAQTLVAALRLSSAGALQPAFIRRQGAGHDMRLKAILHPPAKPGHRAEFAAVLLTALAGASTFAVGGALAHQIDAAAAKAKAVAPAQTDRLTGDAAIHPDVTFQVLFSKGTERLGSPTVIGQFGQDVVIEIPNTMRVVASAERPGPDGQSFTSAKMSIFQNNAWQPPLVMTMRASLSSTPSFEHTIEGTPYRFVVMPRLIVPAASWQASELQRGVVSINVRADFAEKVGGRMIYTGSPSIAANGAPDRLLVKVNGVRKDAGFNVSEVPRTSIARIEVAGRGTSEAAAEGASPDQYVVSLFTKP